MKLTRWITLLFLMVAGIGFAATHGLHAAPIASRQVETERTDINALLMETALMLRRKNSGTSKINYSPSATRTLGSSKFDFVGFGRPRYVLVHYTKSKQVPGQAEIGAVLIFTDSLLRRFSVSIFLVATWSADGEHITVNQARTKLITPPRVQTTLAIVPVTRIPADLFTTYSHAEMLPWIIANRATPKELANENGADYVLFAMVFDRLDPGAKLRILIDDKPDGANGNVANGKDLNYQNWHIAVLRGTFRWHTDEKFYIKVVHDSPAISNHSNVFSVLSSDLVLVNEKGNLITVTPSGEPGTKSAGKKKFNAIADSHVYAFNYRNWNKSNWGVFQNLGAGWHPQGGEKRAYLKFDLSSVNIEDFSKATLKLFHYHTGGGNTVALGVHRVTGSWQEGVGNYKPASIAGSNEITWVNQPSFDPSPELGFNPGKNAGKWIELDITPLVKSWVGGVPNFGLVIKSQGPLQGKPESQYGFYSREHMDSGKHPVLELTRK